MDPAFTEEQNEIRRALRIALSKHCGPDQVKAAARTPLGYDAELWRRLVGQLGLPGLALPVAYGGAGCGPVELALAAEEAGRALLPSPLLATAVLAAPLIETLGTAEQRERWLPRLAEGDLTATLVAPGLATALALTAPNSGDWAGGGRSGGVQADAGGRLYGECTQVLDGHSAGLLLVAAHAGGFARSRTRLYAVPAAAPGLTVQRQTTLDETRPQARVSFRDTPAEPLGEDATEALAGAGAHAAAILAAEAVGAADRALRMTIEYVKVREQFGRPIGSFQAVQHRLADLYVEVEAARSAAYYAAWAAATPEAESAAEAGPLALAQALQAQLAVAGQTIQLHGGIGFTWEHAAHLYFKRAAADELLFGPVHRLRARAAEIAGIFTGEAVAAQ